MGRPRGSKNKSKTNDGEKPAAQSQEIGGNGGPKLDMTDEQRQVLFWQHVAKYKTALASKKTADANFKNAAKAARAELGSTAVKEIKLAIEAETPEGEAAIKERMEAEARVLRWLGMPVGAQGALFPDVDLRPAAEKAHAEGKLAGMKGDRCSPPHDPSVPQHQSWIDGWQEGQAALMREKIKSPDIADDDDADLRPRFAQPGADEPIGDQEPTYSEA